MPDRDNAELGRGQSVANACKGPAFLESLAKRRIPITSRIWRRLSDLVIPISIQRVTEALERLMEEDAAADRPFIAALVISKAHGGLPAPGFFDCARRLGWFAGDPDGQHSWSFHAAELNAVFIGPLRVAAYSRA
jgi:hypothetical protein